MIPLRAMSVIPLIAMSVSDSTESHVSVISQRAMSVTDSTESHVSD